ETRQVHDEDLRVLWREVPDEIRAHEMRRVPSGEQVRLLNVSCGVLRRTLTSIPFPLVATSPRGDATAAIERSWCQRPMKRRGVRGAAMERARKIQAARFSCL